MARTKGNTDYTELESKEIITKLTDLFRNDVGMISIIRDSNIKDKKHIETVLLANYISTHKDLITNIQSIFREYGVEIEPSQAVTKNESIISRKNVVKAVLGI